MLARRWFVGLSCLALLAVIVGCGGPKIVDVQGTVLRDQKPIEMGPNGALQVTLIPDVPPGADYTTYVGRCDAATGKFEIIEVPPGRYKIAIQQLDPNPMTDALRGAYDQQNTKFIQEIDGKTPINIDLPK